MDTRSGGGTRSVRALRRRFLNFETDTLIIGAGAAGIAAAAELARTKQSVIVLEARDRIGGRCWTHHEPGLPVPVELGAEFIHGRSEATFALLRQSGLAAIDARGPNLFAGREKPRERQDLFDEIRSALQAVQLVNDVSFRQLLERNLRFRLSKPAQEFALRLVEGFDAADPTRVSAKAIIEEWTGGGGADEEHFRPFGGYGALLGALVAELEESRVELQLQRIVETVRWKRGRVDVEGTSFGAPFRASARRAIITLPLGVLQLDRPAPGAVRFMPALKAKQRALKRLAAGPVIKVALRFRHAFWEDLDHGRYRDAAFIRTSGTAFPTFWTALPVRIPLLIAWAGGPRAERLSKNSTNATIQLAVKSLEAIFGTRARIAKQLEGAWVHDWQRDPYARGAYSYEVVGAGNARSILAAPLQRTLFFAGEAADLSGEAATVGGALASGKRAAREIFS